MHLFLIRHGETEHNVAGLLAGVTDSRLTNHGLLQAQHLGKHLSGRGLKFTHLYASDLQRAWMTAEEIRKAQIASYSEQTVTPDVVKLELLQEQDFGSDELVPWDARKATFHLNQTPDPGDIEFRPRETARSMELRSEQFWNDYILPLMAIGDEAEDLCVAVVSHGLFLGQLWRTFLSRFDVKNISLGPEVESASSARPLEYLGSWSNTGFLELVIQPLELVSGSPTATEAKVVVENEARPFEWSTTSLRVLMVNGRDHLQNLKRTRGGVGSAPHDTKQKQIEGFFKKRRSDEKESG